MRERPSSTSFSRSLATVAGTARLLADTPFDDVLAMTPALAICAIPSIDRAELSITRPQGRDAVTSAAERSSGGRSGAGSSHSHVIRLPIALVDRTDAGELRLFTRVAGGFDAASMVAAEIMASQVEVALERALLTEAAGPEWQGLSKGYDVGIATGLVMASRGVGREAAYQVLAGIARDRNRTVAEVAAHVIDVGEGGARPPGLRLVTSPGPNAAAPAVPAPPTTVSRRRPR